MTNYRLNKPVIFMFKDYKSENNVVGICSLKTVFIVTIFAFINRLRKKTHYCY